MTQDVFITKVVYPSGYTVYYPLTYFHLLPEEIRKELDQYLVRFRCPCGWVRDPEKDSHGLYFSPTCCLRWNKMYTHAWNIAVQLNAYTEVMPKAWM